MIRLLGLGITCLVVMSTMLLGGAATAGNQSSNLGRANSASTSAKDRTFAEISGCVSTGKTLLTSIVVDESASLKTTDPTALRVTAIETAIDALEDLRSAAPSTLSVQVSLSTFARRFTTLADWRELTKGNATDLRNLARSQLPARQEVNATDYRQALLGAREQLNRRAKSTGSGSTCKLMLWFTDGALDVDAETKTAATQLCRPQGIVDTVRADDISVLALALFTPGGLATPKQRDQLRAVAESSAPGVRCGTSPIPEGSNSGAYLAADDAAALSRLFAGAGALISGASKGESVICPSNDCAGSRFNINIDPGVGGFRVVAQVKGDGRSARVFTPSQKVALPNRGATKSVNTTEGTVQATRRLGLTTITVSLKKIATTSSTWTLDLGKDTGIVDLYWVWGARLEVPSPTLVTGEPALISGKLTDVDGNPLSLANYKSIDVSVRVGSETATTSVSAGGAFRASVSANGHSGMTSAPVSVSVQGVTKKSGTALGPLTSTRNVVTSLPPSFPSISPKEFDLGTISGTASRSAKISIVGSKESDSVVCFGGMTIQSPKGSRISASVPDGKCVSVKALESKTLRVRLAPSQAVDGLAQGALNFQVTSKRNGQALAVAIPVKFDLLRPVDESKRWTLIALLVGLALLLPLIILLISDWLFSRFILTPLHRVAAVPVVVTVGGIHRRDDGPAPFTSRELVNLPESRVRRVREYSDASFPGTFTARGAWNVIRGSRATVVGKENSLVVSSVRPFGSGQAASQTFGRIETWFVTSDGSLTESDGVLGTLVAIVADQSLDELNESVASAPWEVLHSILLDAAKSKRAQTAREAGTAPHSVANASGGDASIDWMTESDPEHPSAGLMDSPSFLDDEPPVEQPESGRGKLRGRQTKNDPEPGPDQLPDIDFLN